MFMVLLELVTKVRLVLSVLVNVDVVVAVVVDVVVVRFVPDVVVTVVQVVVAVVDVVVVRFVPDVVVAVVQVVVAVVEVLLVMVPFNCSTPMSKVQRSWSLVPPALPPCTQRAPEPLVSAPGSQATTWPRRPVGAPGSKIWVHRSSCT